MYRLQVFYEGAPRPRETVELDRAGAVLTEIPKILEKHRECARVEVWINSTRLFAVDCAGNRLD